MPTLTEAAQALVCRHNWKRLVGGELVCRLCNAYLMDNTELGATVFREFDDDQP